MVPVAWRYMLGLLAQTVGTPMLLVTVLPRYREFLRDSAPMTKESWHLTASFSWIVLMQLGYWFSRSLPPPAPRSPHPVPGQAIRFAGRLVFMFVTSLFSFLFITRAHRVVLPGVFAVVAVFGLFSLYCYTDHVERLGQAVATGRSDSGAREPNP